MGGARKFHQGSYVAAKGQGMGIGEAQLVATYAERYPNS